MAKIRTCPSSHTCHCFLQVWKGTDRKQPRKSGDTVFPIIILWKFFSDIQGQLTPQSVVQSGRNLTRPSSHACHHYLQVSKGTDEKQPRKSGDTVFPIIALCYHGNQWLNLAEFQTHPSSRVCYHYLQV